MLFNMVLECGIYQNAPFCRGKWKDGSKKKKVRKEKEEKKENGNWFVEKMKTKK